MPRQVHLPRGIDGHFLELRNYSATWVETLRGLAEEELGSDPLENAEANLEVVREFFSKWTIDLLVTIYSLHSAGFEELRRHLRGITPRVLSGRLKALEARRLILRIVLNARPPRVQYRLAPEGLMFMQLGEPAFLYLRVHIKGPR